MPKILPFPTSQPVATCKCGSFQFYMLLDGYGDGWGTIIGIECVSCGDFTDWIKVEREEE